MDGTLTVPKIDFQKMRERVGVPPGKDILATVAYALTLSGPHLCRPPHAAAKTLSLYGVGPVSH